MPKSYKRLMVIIRDHHPTFPMDTSPWHSYYSVWREIEKGEPVEVVVEFMKFMKGNMFIPRLQQVDREQFARLAEAHLCRKLREAMPKAVEPRTPAVRAMFEKPNEELECLKNFEGLLTLLDKIMSARDSIE